MPTKTTLSLSIDAGLKKRLLDIKVKSGIPVAKLIEQMLKKNMPEYEKKYNINPELDF